MDKIVFDIETKNSFDDVGGHQNLKDLLVSVVGAYSYSEDKYYVFGENELEGLIPLFKRAGLLIGFWSKYFDIPVLEKHFDFKIASIPHFDILEEIEKSFGRRVSLGVLAQANLGAGKTGYGLEAIEMYKRGEIEKLKSYCLQDVKLTKEIFDQIMDKGYVWIPQRNLPEMVKVTITYKEEVVPQAGLF
ncbi:MAG TPA: ribonuclease H-like domain-containing protein [Candidatus Paceibacterota bacterium]|nr:ribonuclease H-like domain-containing protein [Candidatus Paceibacterota bacterium]